MDRTFVQGWLPTSWEVARCAHVSTTFSWCRHQLLWRRGPVVEHLKGVAALGAPLARHLVEVLADAQLDELLGVVRGPRREDVEGDVFRQVVDRELCAAGAEAHGHDGIRIDLRGRAEGTPGGGGGRGGARGIFLLRLARAWLCPAPPQGILRTTSLFPVAICAMYFHISRLFAAS